MTRMAIKWPFVGSDAVANGAIRKHELRSHYRTVFPDIYVPRDAVLTLRLRAVAAWLWSHREGVIAGLTASALHGAKWVDDSSPIEFDLVECPRPPWSAHFTGYAQKCSARLAATEVQHPRGGFGNDARTHGV